jgi:hypothetical protein
MIEPSGDPTQQPDPSQAPAPQQPASGGSWLSTLAKGALVGLFSGLASSKGATSFSGGLAAGAGGALQQQQQVKQNQLADDANNRANQDQQNQNQEAKNRSAQMQLQNRELSMKLHALDPHDPAYVQETISKLADQGDAGLKAGALLKTPEFKSAVEAEQYVHQNHLDNGNYQVRVSPYRNASGEVVYGGLEYDNSPSTADVKITYQGPEGKTATAVVPAGTPKNKIAELQVAAANQAVNAKFKEHDDKLKDQGVQAQNAGQLLFEDKLAPSQIPSKGGLRVQATMIADQMAKQNGKADGYNAESADAEFKNRSSFMVGSDADGRQVVGTPDELKTAGVTGTSKLDSGDVGKVVVARQLTSPGGLFDLVDKDLAQFKPEELTALNGRWNEFMSGKVGSGDPRFAALRTHTHLLSTAMMQAHVGASGGENIMEHFANIADSGKMDGPTLKAALAAEKQYVNEKAARPQAKKNK